jgi:hypothetical protein
MEDREPDEDREPTETLPKTGLRVPVPTRGDVMAAIAKVSELDDRDDEPSDTP